MKHPIRSRSLETLLETLEFWFTGIDKSVTAFSGGIDSSLVLYLSRKFLCKKKALGCISDSPALKRADLELAETFCSEHDIRLEIIHTTEIDDEAYFSNPSNRCFACKTHLYRDLARFIESQPGFVILNGTNAEDFGDYRPGLLAAKEHEVRSPLAECGIGKAEVRLLAKELGLSNWDKPASPCLSSRIPYGSPVTREKLSQIEAAEAVLLHYGFSDARVRHFDTESKIEVPSSDIPALVRQLPHIEKALKGLGFKTVCIDEEGLVSGKLNRAIGQ